MNKIITIFLFLFIFSCSTQDDKVCEDGSGYLYKNGEEFVCSFNIQKRVGYKNWIDINLERTDVFVVPYDWEDYFTSQMGVLGGGWPTYGISMKVPKEHFTETQYAISIKTVDKNLNECGESREFIFHRIEEINGMAIYHSIVEENYENSENGKELFFGEREMPSYNWYHVLKICNDRKNFILMGEIKG